jgi:hypothetical protein
MADEETNHSNGPDKIQVKYGDLDHSNSKSEVSVIEGTVNEETDTDKDWISEDFWLQFSAASSLENLDNPDYVLDIEDAQSTANDVTTNTTVKLESTKSKESPVSQERVRQAVKNIMAYSSPSNNKTADQDLPLGKKDTAKFTILGYEFDHKAMHAIPRARRDEKIRDTIPARVRNDESIQRLRHQISTMKLEIFRLKNTLGLMKKTLRLKKKILKLMNQVNGLFQEMEELYRQPRQ